MNAHYRMFGLFSERGDLMKTEDVQSENSRKLVISIVRILLAILVLGSTIDESIGKN